MSTFDTGFAWAESAKPRPLSIEAEAVVAEARAGIDLLRSLNRPTWLREPDWRTLCDDARRFATAWLAEAAGMGWTVPLMFGCEPLPWHGRLDRLGIVPLLDGRPVIAMTADSATIANPNGAPHTFRIYPGKTPGTAMWIAYARERPC